MPLRNKKARQAKAQQVQSKKFIKKGSINNLDIQNDPDWVNKGDSDTKSESESLAEREMLDLAYVSDSVDEDKNTEDSSDEGEEGVEDAEAQKILRTAEGF